MAMEDSLGRLESRPGTEYVVACLEDLLVLRDTGGDVETAAHNVKHACLVATYQGGPTDECRAVAAAAARWERRARWSRRVRTVVRSVCRNASRSRSR
jgi:hypothetical protein